ncbi:MAG: Cys-tRNA(Pro) deacylase [Firmicutes bacterium]|nr:Cys-tRNA(Pro) deacylase [Bacillota bacterium]
MAKKDDKTNVMRILAQAKIEYAAHSYGDGKTALSGAEVAAELGQDPACVFKTLVTVGRSGGHYVFMIPVLAELDLKKAASAAGEKSVEMIKQKDLLPLTGYVHGGCSPIGMKKPFPTFIDESCILYDYIYVSAGVRGLQFKINPDTLVEFVGAETVDLIAEKTE